MPKTAPKSLFASSTAHFDAKLASLFEVKAPRVAPVKEVRVIQEEVEEEDGDSEVLSEISDDVSADEEGVEVASDGDTDSDGAAEIEASGDESGPNGHIIPTQQPDLAPRQAQKKRKRDNDDLEARYFERLAREDARDETGRDAKQRKVAANGDGAVAVATAPVANLQGDTIHDSDGEGYTIPVHESVASGLAPDAELEKAERTVFLGNVSSTAITSKAAKRSLTDFMGAFLPSLPAGDKPHKIESLRFRSTAYATKMPKKGAFANKTVMDATTKSTNAYVVYTTKDAAAAACKLNGAVVLDRHLRVDLVSRPAQVDNKRCVFVGNLGFVDDESLIKAAEAPGDAKAIAKARRGDAEEGLWREFARAGTVESVRVVRDAKTRVGKGFAYVQFTDEDAVEEALLFNDQKFPPLLPRKLRVMRAKRVKKSQSKAPARPVAPPTRAKKLLGRAGGAGKGADAKVAFGHAGLKPPESFVFEGHRASNTEGSKAVLGKKGPKKGKPTNRGARRGASWKAGGAGGKKRS